MSLREFLEMCVSHSCACVCRARDMCFVGLGSCLKVIESGGSSLWDTRWAIFARVFTVNVLVLLITIGMIFMSAFRFACP